MITETDLMKCDICGKFTKMEETEHEYTPDNYFGPEEITDICQNCWNKGRKNEN